jgi:hypothetical protein
VTCTSVHALVHGERGEGETDREGPQQRERKGGARATAQRLAARARETEREEGRARERQLAPTGRPQWAERERVGEKAAADRRGPPVRQRGRACVRPNWAELG